MAEFALMTATRRLSELSIFIDTHEAPSAVVIHTQVIPDGPWKQPLVRAIIPCPTAANMADSSQLTLTVGVYFTRYERLLLPTEEAH